MTVKANLQVKEKNMGEIFVIQNHLNVFKCLTIVYLRHNPHLCFEEQLRNELLKHRRDFNQRLETTKWRLKKMSVSPVALRAALGQPSFLF